MNKFISAIKKIRLGQILVTCLAGILLFVSTACNSVQAKTPQSGKNIPGAGMNQRNGRLETPSNDPRLSPYEGGMNDYSDVDPRARNLEKAAGRKAETLRENAERNVIDQTSDVGENTKRILDKKGENAADFGRNLGRNAENAVDKATGTAENLAKGTKRGTENIKENTSDALRGVDKNVTRATEDTKDTARDLTKSAQRKAGDTADYAQSKADQAAQNTQRNLNRAGNAARDAMD